MHFQKAFLRYTDDVAARPQPRAASPSASVELDPLDPVRQFHDGAQLLARGRSRRQPRLARARDGVSPNYAQGIYARAWTETLSGARLGGREDVDLAMALSPLDPLALRDAGDARLLAHGAAARTPTRADWAERAARGHPARTC